MKFKPYPKYKPSGIDWLGAVPDHWSSRPIKCEATFWGGGTPSKDTPEYWNGDIPWVSPKDMKTEVVVDTEDHVTILGVENSAINSIPAGCVLIVVRSGILKHTIPVAINAVSVTLNQDMKALQFSQNLSSSFFFRWVQGLNEPLLKAWSKLGVTVESIEHDFLANCHIAFPNTLEQNAIVAFLDHETAKIDTLIAKQERLIDLLKEKRQAVISYAVTKGLDPTVPMKPSGVEWLGDVPKHWNIAPLKYHMTMESGGTPSKDNTEYWGHGYPWASAKDLKVETLHDTVDHITQAAIDKGAASLVDKNCVLLVVRGMILLHTLPVVVNAVPMAINQDLKALRAAKSLTASFLAWLLRGLNREILGRTDQAAHGTKALRTDDLIGLQIPVPSIDDQVEISKYLDTITSKIDALIGKAQAAITLQKEHRIALISAAVTGKIDVRTEISSKEAA